MASQPVDAPVEISVSVNGRSCTASVEPRMLLVTFLRDVLGLTGAHVGCVVGRCGACTVLWDGRVVKSCMVLAVQTDGSEVTTVEGLADGGRLSPLQESFWRNDAAECGYCTPGMLMAAHGLLQRVADPSVEEVRHAISGNLCRCTGYVNIVKAVRDCASVVAGQDGEPDGAVTDGAAVGE